MGRFDRYLLSQLLVVFGFFSLVLVLIYWINRAVVLFDRLIADGQSAWVFLELTSLTLPTILRIVLPLSAFAAAVYVTNRMSTESELTVVQATGYSSFRLARPVLVFGIFVAILMSALTHFLVPMSTERLQQRQLEISQNMTARLLTPGQFLSPSIGTTFYIREITEQGELLDVFLSESSDRGQRVTYTANRAFLVRSDNGPQLVMIDGLAQTLDLETNRLLTTGFDDFAFDIGSLIDDAVVRDRSARELRTSELLSPTPALVEETGTSAARLIIEGHDRFAQALMAVAAALIGFSALLQGSYSRFGLWRQIVFAISLVILVKVLESLGTSAAQSSPALWPLVYTAGVSGMAISATLLFMAGRPSPFRRRDRGMVAT